MHTGEAALKHRRLAGKEGLFVDLMHLTALLGKVIPGFQKQALTLKEL